MNVSELSKSGEWETPQELYDMLCEKYQIKPKLDVCATSENSKCARYFNKGHNALHTFIVWDRDSWCNPDHNLTEEFVKKAYTEWEDNNINIMMILPANSMCTNYAERFIWNYAEFHPINRKYCKFLHSGKEIDGARNGYFVVIWRRT